MRPANGPAARRSHLLADGLVAQLPTTPGAIPCNRPHTSTRPDSFGEHACALRSLTIKTRRWLTVIFMDFRNENSHHNQRLRRIMHAAPYRPASGKLAEDACGNSSG
jgi:hypothetical protein